MKIWAIIAAVAALLAAFVGTYYAGATFGGDKCEVKQDTATLSADRADRKQAQVQGAIDFTAAARLSTGLLAISATTWKLEGAVNAPEPSPVPAAGTHADALPGSPFPVAFGVCWNAASSRDPAAAAACETSRGDGAVSGELASVASRHRPDPDAGSSEGRPALFGRRVGTDLCGPGEPGAREAADGARDPRAGHGCLLHLQPTTGRGSRLDPGQLIAAASQGGDP